ncbi:MAG: hypothetical protein ACK5KO_10930 [Arachnia sp.]
MFRNSFVRWGVSAAALIFAGSALTSCVPQTGASAESGDAQATGVETEASAPAATDDPVQESDPATEETEVSESQDAEPADGGGVSDQQLDFTGLGSIQVGMSAEELVAEGLIEPDNEDACLAYTTNAELSDLGVSVVVEGEMVTEVVLMAPENGGPGMSTVDSASPGMTVAEVREIYGEAFTVVEKEGNGGAFLVGSVVSDGNELVFLTDWDTPDTFDDDEVIMSISAREDSDVIYGGDC